MVNLLQKNLKKKLLSVNLEKVKKHEIRVNNYLYTFQSFFKGWGMTELSPVGTMTAANDEVLGSCGILVPNTQGIKHK